MAPDLPLELWLHVLGLLPKHYLRKMMGINRTLFELAMNEMYQEIRFIEDGQDMARILDQLKYVHYCFDFIQPCDSCSTSYPHISQRVQHLYIRPGFFSQMDGPPQGKISQRSTGDIWKKYFCLSADVSLESSRSLGRLESQGGNILSVAQDALARCQRVEEITIVLHDLLPPPTFPTFLRAMWTSLGPRLSKLNIDATLVKLPLLFDPDIARDLSRLTDLNIHLAVSRFPYVSQRNSLIPQILLPFIVSLKGTLESLTLSSAEVLDLSPLFHGLGYFPHLQKLDLHIVMNRLTTLTDPHALTFFMTLHKYNLRHFSMRVHHPSVLNNPSDVSYEIWVTETLSNIEFPVLESLTLGLYAGYPLKDTIIPRLCSAKLPNLVSVAFSDIPLSHNDIQAILSHVAGAIPWQTLRLNVMQLSPQLIDTLAAQLPHLNELDLSYGSIEPHRYPYPSYDVSGVPPSPLDAC